MFTFVTSAAIQTCLLEMLLHLLSLILYDCAVATVNFVLLLKCGTDNIIFLHLMIF